MRSAHYEHQHRLMEKRLQKCQEERQTLLDALEFAERRSRQPGENHTAFFERIAQEFYYRHGYLAPGKDDPINCAVSQEQKRDAWDAFLAEPSDARRAALAKLKTEAGDG